MKVGFSSERQCAPRWPRGCPPPGPGRRRVSSGLGFPAAPGFRAPSAAPSPRKGSERRRKVRTSENQSSRCVPGTGVCSVCGAWCRTACVLIKMCDTIVTQMQKRDEGGRHIPRAQGRQDRRLMGKVWPWGGTPLPRADHVRSPSEESPVLFAPALPGGHC